MRFADAAVLADKIEGWFTDAEAEMLFDIVSKLQGNGAIVEIGSWCGKSLTYFTLAALGASNPCKIISIDPFLTSNDTPNGKYETFIQNLETNNILDKITHIKEKSQIVGKTFDTPIEFLFIDGFHKYDYVKSDFELFFDKIVNEGYFAVHDVTSYEGPYLLVKEIADTYENIKLTGFKDATILAQKVEKLSDSDKAQNQSIINSLEKFVVNSGIRLIR